MKTADQFLTEAAETFKAKNAVYGDNYLNVGVAMAGMFPNGLLINTPDDWNRLHIFLLGIVKQTRYANNWSAGGHADSAHDNTVYSAMLESIDAEIAGRKPGGLSIDFASGDDKTVFTLVNGQGAITSSMEICDHCSTPITCGERQKCYTDAVKSFSPCNNCSTTTMCNDEEHCDRVSNGYR